MFDKFGVFLSIWWCFIQQWVDFFLFTFYPLPERDRLLYVALVRLSDYATVWWVSVNEIFTSVKMEVHLWPGETLYNHSSIETGTKFESVFDDGMKDHYGIIRNKDYLTSNHIPKLELG